MMKVMPITLRFRKGKFFNQRFLFFQIFNHLLYSDIIVGNSRRLTVTFDAKMLELYDQSGLMRFGSLGNSEGMTEFEIVWVIRDLHSGGLGMNGFCNVFVTGCITEYKQMLSVCHHSFNVLLANITATL